MAVERAQRGSPPTISEVAKEAGVGRATAARTLGNYGYVSAELRERVLAAAEKLGYRANSLARSMSTGVSHTFGVIVADIANPFFAGVIGGIATTSRSRGFDTLVLSTGESLELERDAVGLLIDKRVDGIIIASAAVTADQTEHIRDAQQRDIPIVLVDRIIEHLPTDAVVIDNREAARAAVRLLLDAGHERIGFVWGPELPQPVSTRRELEAAAAATLWTDGERLRGYLDALDDGGIVVDPTLISSDEKTEAGALRSARAMLSTPNPPTAIFTTETDAMTGTIRAMRELSLDFPGDVSLVGFDDASWAAIMDPPLTMVEQPMTQLGVVAAERLLARIDGDTEPARVLTLSTRLIERASVRAIESARTSTE